MTKVNFYWRNWRPIKGDYKTTSFTETVALVPRVGDYVDHQSMRPFGYPRMLVKEVTWRPGLNEADVELH